MIILTSKMVCQYSLLVDFLGRMLGPDYEIVLHDVGRKRSTVVAIVNGHISGRSVGAPLTNVALQIIAEKTYLIQDWKLNYQGVSASGKALRCSTFFIKDEKGTLSGLLCINFDDSRYQELSAYVFALCHPDAYATNISIRMLPLPLDALENPEQETFYKSIATAVDGALRSVLNDSVLPPERLTQSEKLEIIQRLDEKGIFLMKGAISVVAEKLSCSQASIYRYLSKIHKEKL